MFLRNYNKILAIKIIGLTSVFEDGGMITLEEPVYVFPVNNKTKTEVNKETWLTVFTLLN